MAGICNTDLEIARGYMGYAGTLGHEFVGEVVQGSPGLLGKRVVGEINVGCGNCAACRAGLQRHCPTRSVLGIVQRQGCFAEYISLPEANLHVVPEALADTRACFTEPVAAAWEIIEQCGALPTASPRVLVLGDGKLGLLIAQVLHHHGWNITVLGRHRHKLALLKSLDIHTTCEVPAERFDRVVEATGSEGGLHQALQLLRPRGTLILKSTYEGAVQLDMSTFVIHELTLLGSRCGPFAPALAAMAAGSIDPSPLVEQTFALSQGEEAFAHASQRGALKVLLDMQPGAD